MAGGIRVAGATTLDILPGADVNARIPPLPEQITAQRWDVVEWIHGPGQLAPWEAEEVIQQLRRCARRVIAETPDFNRCRLVEDFFGDPSFKRVDHMVRWAYTPESLWAVFRRAGFHSIRVLPAEYHNPDRDFRIEACA